MQPPGYVNHCIMSSPLFQQRNVHLTLNFESAMFRTLYTDVVTICQSNMSSFTVNPK